MRRPPSRFSGASSLLIGAAVVVVATVVVGPAAAFAEDPTPTPSASSSAGAGAADPYISAATPGEAGCAVPSTLDEITGMVATDKGTYVVEGGDREDPSAVKITLLDATCAATTKTYTGGINPRDPEDLAIGSDGTLYIADIGDNPVGGSPERERIAVEKAPAAGGKATIYRMVYPNAGKFDAEAMLLDKDDVPIIFTQEGGKAGIYKPTKALVPDITSNLPLMEKVGVFTPQKTGTANQMGVVGQSLVTGAAKSPDGKSVVIRTRSDAYEFTVGEDGDIVTAITEGKPVITRLPNEPQGEAISYSADGTKFVTISVKPKGATANPKLLSYTRHVPDLGVDPGGPGDELPAAPGAGQSWFDRLSFSELTRIVAAVGVVGLVLAISGIVGIRRARKRRREEEDEYDYDDYDDDPRGRGRRGRGGRDREDEHSFSGLRDPQYAEAYDQYGGGYADAGYGSNGYAGNGYGGGYADQGYGGAHSGQAHGANAYGGAQYGADPYGQQYGAPQYGDQPQYSAPQADYGAYGGQQPGADYGGQQNYGADYGGQAQGQHGGQYGGYGYEEDFDPMQDPRRR